MEISATEMNMIDQIDRCSKCILPTSLPSVHLDKKGVCNHCRDFERKFADWDATREKRRKIFENTVERVKRLNRPYDCCIPLSGGKDSTYALYICDHVYKMKCLAITFDNGFLSDQAYGNIDRAIRHSSADHIFYTVNRDTMLALYRQFMISTGNFCSACMRGIGMVQEFPPRTYNIPLVVTGNGLRNSYLSMFPEVFAFSDEPYFKNVLKDADVGIRCGSLCSTNLNWTLRRIRQAGMYILRKSNLAQQYTLNLYDYFDPSRDEIYPKISQEMGWQIKDGIYEHSDCLLHPIPFFMHTLKFPELSKNTFYLSHQIRLGQLSRNEAMEQELTLIKDRTPPPVLVSFLKEIGMNMEEFTAFARDWHQNVKYQKR